MSRPRVSREASRPHALEEWRTLYFWCPVHVPAANGQSTFTRVEARGRHVFMYGRATLCGKGVSMSEPMCVMAGWRPAGQGAEYLKYGSTPMVLFRLIAVLPEGEGSVKCLYEVCDGGGNMFPLVHGVASVYDGPQGISIKYAIPERLQAELFNDDTARLVGPSFSFYDTADRRGMSRWAGYRLDTLVRNGVVSEERSWCVAYYNPGLSRTAFSLVQRLWWTPPVSEYDLSSGDLPEKMWKDAPGPVAGCMVDIGWRSHERFLARYVEHEPAMSYAVCLIRREVVPVGEEERGKFLASLGDCGHKVDVLSKEQADALLG